MKKIFFALAALVLAFTGCSQEEDAIQVSEKKAIKVVVNMDKPGFGEDTRAPRQGWEEGDQVVVMLNDDLEHLILLGYNGTSWKETVLFFDVAYGEWAPKFSKPGQVDEAATAVYLASLPSSGDLKAIYCSSGISYFAPIPEETETVNDLEGIDIISNARDNGYFNEDLEEYIPTPYGECIMTCEGGTYIKDGELTLTIEMEPRVAQFTIRDLSAGTGDDKGKTSEGYEVGVAGGNLVAYTGGTIRTNRIELNPVYEVGYYNACWVHPNTDGISIYASPYAGLNEFEDYETYIFQVDNYIREFNCNDYKDRIYNGAAIIMDGPTDATKAAGKWYIPA